MNKFAKFFVVSFLVYLLYGTFLSRYEIRVLPASLQNQNPRGFYDYSGVMNIHTLESTGSGSLDDIVTAAQEVGLDFIFITDLNNYSPLKKHEKYYNQLLVFIDGEFSYLDSRLLNYGREDYTEINSPGQAQMIFSDLLGRTEKPKKTGVLVLAHPFKKGYQWQGDVPKGMDGIEVVNLKSIWQNAWLNDKASFLWSLLFYPFNPELALIRMFPFPHRELALWDEMNLSRKTIGFAGADAEARLKFPKNSSLKIPSYENIFNIVRTHVLLSSELTGNAESDRQKIYRALHSGQFYFSLDKMANPKGFNSLVTDGKNHSYPIGSELKWRENLRLWVTLPEKPHYPFDVMIFKDGHKILSSNSKETSYVIPAPGVYRVIIRVIPTFPLPDGKKWIPWIFTNPFFIKGA